MEIQLVFNGFMENDNQILLSLFFKSKLVSKEFATARGRRQGGGTLVEKAGRQNDLLVSRHCQIK